MFNNLKNMKEGIERLDTACNIESFERAVSAIKDYMKSLGVDSKHLLELENISYFMPNTYSDKDTYEKMLEAKKRIRNYIDEFMKGVSEDKRIDQILQNFYLFLENLFERKPHKKAGLQKEQLENLKIRNEYDVQHLLYAYIKPLYPMARVEVNEDTGYGTVRADIFLDAESIIEVKCTRQSMILKKLVEEIEADMIHYGARRIYFFIYDKEKIIENPQVFRETYETKMKEKQIRIIIHQPKEL